MDHKMTRRYFLKGGALARHALGQQGLGVHTAHKLQHGRSRTVPCARWPCLQSRSRHFYYFILDTT